MSDPRAKLKINYIGDSHSVLTFGQTILAELETISDIHFLAFSGMKLQFLTDWLAQKDELRVLNFEKKSGHASQTSKIPTDLGKTFNINQADILVIALGTNDIVQCAARNSQYGDLLFSLVQQQLKKISVKKVLFIEPPLLGVDTELKIRQAMLTQIVSFGFNADQTDGVHMKKEMAEKFGKSVSKELLKLILPHH
jgi:lysophospholipase L1-like esterase